MLVERIDNAICIEKTGKLVLTMGAEHSKPKIKHKPKHTHVQGNLIEMEACPILHCWKCWKDAENPSQDKKPQKKPKRKTLRCIHCNQMNHNVEH
jgi:hypothetical protein